MKKKTKTPPATPEPVSEKDRFYANMNKFLEQEIGSRVQGTLRPAASPAPFSPMHVAENYEGLDEEGKKTVDALMEEMKPDIEKKAYELLFSEIRDKIAKSGDIKKLSEAMKKGKKIEVKRKKGCIFLQIGSGNPDDPIDEFMVAST